MLADDPDSNGATVEINVDIMVEAKGIELEVWTGLELDTLALINGTAEAPVAGTTGGAIGFAFGADGGTAGAAKGATVGVANGATCLFFRRYIFILIFCGIFKTLSCFSLKLATTRSECGALFKILDTVTGVNAGNRGAFLVFLIIGRRFL